MNKPPLLTSNFAHLQEHDAQFLRLGMLAERYFPDDPDTTLLRVLDYFDAVKIGLTATPALYPT